MVWKGVRGWVAGFQSGTFCYPEHLLPFINMQSVRSHFTEHVYKKRTIGQVL